MRLVTRTQKLWLALVAGFGLAAAGQSACVSGEDISDNPLLAGSGNTTRGTGGRTTGTRGSGASATSSGGGTGGTTARGTGGALPAGGAGAAPPDGGSGGSLAAGGVGAAVAGGGDGNQGGFILLAGASGIAAVDCPGAADIPPQPGSLRVQYRTSNTNDESDIAASFRILKSELGYVPLVTLKMRYWYTPDGVTDQVLECFYAAVGSANITHEFGPDYVEIGFTEEAGNLTPNPGDANDDGTGEIQIAIHDSSYQLKYTQSNDYSFDATKQEYADSATVTLYYCGQLVWGTEPG